VIYEVPPSLLPPLETCKYTFRSYPFPDVDTFRKYDYYRFASQVKAYCLRFLFKVWKYDKTPFSPLPGKQRNFPLFSEITHFPPKFHFFFFFGKYKYWVFSDRQQQTFFWRWWDPPFRFPLHFPLSVSKILGEPQVTCSLSSPPPFLTYKVIGEGGTSSKGLKSHEDPVSVFSSWLRGAFSLLVI